MNLDTNYIEMSRAEAHEKIVKAYKCIRKNWQDYKSLLLEKQLRRLDEERSNSLWVLLFLDLRH